MCLHILFLKYICYKLSLFPFREKLEKLYFTHKWQSLRCDSVIIGSTFADDSLLFCRASIQECMHIQNLLSTYEEASGKKLNRDKTTLFFSKNTDSKVQESIKDLLGVLKIKQYEKYLGLPSFVGRNKKASLTFIKERVWKKLQGWKEKLLS